jgi:diguanylate cyclase (GGDEF)-like protein/PAS domain S-box-containing protein
MSREGDPRDPKRALGSRSDFKRVFSPTLDRLVLAAIIVTALACYFREPLTRRSLTILPEDAGKTFDTVLTDDRAEGGSSVASHIGPSPLDWACRMTTKYRWAYCNFGLVFDRRNAGRGLDLRRFTKIKVRLVYEGPGRSVRVALNNHDRAYTALGAPSADKRSQASTPVSQGEQDLEFTTEDLSVAQWWRDAATEQSRELARVDLNNVRSMEVITGSEARPGKHHLVLKRLVLEGATVTAATWYAALLLAWIFIIGGLMLQRRRETAGWLERLTTSLQTTLNTIPHMVWSMDENGRFHFNTRWNDFTGAPLGETQPIVWLDLIHPDELQPVSEAWEECAAAGDPFEIECRLQHCSGDYRWILARAVPATDAKTGIRRWYGTCTDIHDRVAAQRALLASVASERHRGKQLKWASEHDALTFLPNRRAFQSRLDAAVANGRGENPREIGLLLIDLDHFKHVNDSLGHFAGDRLLKVVAERLAASVRQEDFVARLGGDEFAVLLHGSGSDKDLRRLGKALLATIQAPLKIDDHVIRPGASIGAANFPASATNADDLFKAADAALYALKRSGRGGFKLFQDYMLEDVKRAAVQLGRAREIVADNSILAFYQPKIAVRDGAVVGFEALLRYRSPTVELGLPDSIEEAFKDYDLAAKIGELMQLNVARDIRQWRDAGFTFGRVSINASPAEFLRDDYAERLLKVLQRYDVPAHCIEVEVTEHALLDRGPEYVARALKVLKQAEISIALDDFGTGYSSLSHIRDFPVDVIKIHQSFIAQITTDSEVAALIAGMVHLASSLGLSVVAEGVETAEQLQLLRSVGCDVAQGHLFAAAADASATAALFSPNAAQYSVV